MATLLKRTKALTVNPLKSSQPLGATLAFLGLNSTVPLMHGSQGCTAFAKVMFVRHFREPIPLQTTALDQVSTVMGGDASLVEALATLFSRNRPRIVGVMTTGLTETQGTDITRAIRQFRAEHPEFAEGFVVPVNTPDFTGGLESGYAAAVAAIIETLVPDARAAGTRPGTRARQVNILAGATLTPGDLETIKAMAESFDLRPVVLPDISDSLDGHLGDEAFTPHTTGGTSLSDIVLMGESAATLVIGPSLCHAAEVLEQRTGVPTHRFDHLYGLVATDRFVHALSHIAHRPVPPRLERQRAQLQDAMVDCHFMLGQWRTALAGEPDQLLALTELLQGMGAEVVCAVAPARGEALGPLPIPDVKIGDLEDLEHMARESGAEVLIGNSHCAQSAERLDVPLFRLGFPQYDVLGGYQRARVGYDGTRQLLFDLANLALEHEGHAIAPYRSVYGQKTEYHNEEPEHGIAASVAGA